MLFALYYGMKSTISLIFLMTLAGLTSGCRNVPYTGPEGPIDPPSCQGEDCLGNTGSLDAPTSLMGIALSPSSIQVFWELTTTIEDLEVRVEGKKSYLDDDQYEHFVTTAAVDGFVTLNGLSSDQEYNIRIQAVSGDLTSDFVNPISVTTLSEEQNLNAPIPFNIQTTPIEGGIELDWEWSNTNAGLIDEVEVQRRLQGNQSWGYNINVANTQTSYTDVGAVSGSQYQYRLHVIYDDGTTYTTSATAFDTPIVSTLPAVSFLHTDDISVTGNSFTVELDWYYDNALVDDMDYFLINMWSYDHETNTDYEQFYVTSTSPAGQTDFQATWNICAMVGSGCTDVSWFYRVYPRSINDTLDDGPPVTLEIRCTNGVCTEQ